MISRQSKPVVGVQIWLVMKCDYEDKWPVKAFHSEAEAKSYEEDLRRAENQRAEEAKTVPYGFMTQEVELVGGKP